MRRALALAIVVTTALLVRRVPVAAVDARSIGLAAGFALLAAVLAGDLIARLHLPRVTGYLLFGLVAGPSVSNLISRPMARELRLIDGVAVALIAMMAGLEMNVATMRPRLASIARVGGVTIAILYTGLYALLYVIWPWVPILPAATGTLKTAVVALTAAIVTSFSPTVTMAVIAENRAAGPLTELTMAVVILADLLLVLAFGLTMQLVRYATGGAADDVGLFVHLSWEIAGSLAFGALVGAVLAFYLRTIGREVAIVLIAACAVISEIGGRLYFEPVLGALAAGLVVENVAPPRGDTLREGVERSALPILIVFFAAAGASLRLDALRETGLIAVGLAVVRLGLIRGGAAAGARAGRIASPDRDLLWRGLVPQAGLTIGLTVIIASEYPEWGVPLQTLALAMIALHLLVGPVLFRTALVRAGEIGGGRESLTGPR
jgi:Kef-type K+ transport system membrane component KefB